MDSLPKARICHRTARRLRIRIPARKGDGRYFQGLVEVLASDGGMLLVSANPVTGSLLVEGEAIDVGRVRRLGAERQLFDLEESAAAPLPLSCKIVAPLGDLDNALRGATGGEVDMAGAVFVALLASGIYEISRGNFALPAWYTAFWYAFGVFSKSAGKAGK